MADNGLTPEASARHWQARLDNTRSTFERIRALHGEDGEATKSVARQLVEHTDAYNAARARLEAAAQPEQPEQPAREAYTAEDRESFQRAARLAVPNGGGVEFGRIESQRDPLTYRKDNQAERSFFRDATHAKMGDIDAAERIGQHRREMRDQYDLSTGSNAGSELLIPKYLNEAFADYARASRPLVQFLGVQQLPPYSDTITIPRATGGTAVAVQSTQNNAIQETDMAFDQVTSNIVTIAGMQDVSVQLWDRSQPGIGQIVFADLAGAYAVKSETDLLNANSTNYKGLLNVTSPNTQSITTTTVSSLYSKIVGGASDIGANYLKSAPDFIALHPRRWAATLAGSAGSSNFPLITPVNPVNAQGTVSGAPGQDGVVGSIAGIPVVATPNMPTTLGSSTNEDRVILGVRREVFAWEAGPFLSVHPDVGSANLTTRLRLFGYWSIQAGRYPKSLCIISGSGLASPSF